MPEGEPIEHPIVNRSIAKAQNRVESRNFDIRKQLLEYDDVANDQRRVIYQQRNELLEVHRHRRHHPQHDRRSDRRHGQALHSAGVRRGAVGHPGLEAALASEFQMQAPVGEWLKSDPDITDDKVRDRLNDAALAQYASKEAQVGADLMRQFERSLMLQTLDQHWRDHLANLDHLRQGIHLRGYAQKNPKQEYKRESFELFSDMLDRIKQDVVKIVLTVQVRTRRSRRRSRRRRRSATSSTSTRITTRRSPPTAADPPRRRRAVRPRRRKGRAQRSVSVRIGEEVQALSRAAWVAIRPLSPAPMPVRYTPPAPEQLLAVPGVALGTAAAGIKSWQRDDVLLAVFDPGTTAAGVFTQNRFCAAPVQVCRRHLAQAGGIRALIVNAGNANAGTGAAGIAAAEATCAAVASMLGCAPQHVLPFSTGVIMEPFPVEKIVAALPSAHAALAPAHWFAAVEAIMTTDTVPKGASRRVDLGGAAVTVTGIAKGAGMIHPDMATMLSFIATDAPIAAALLAPLTREIADVSFNCATIDGDTSTNDSFVITATGRAPIAPIERARRSSARAATRRSHGCRRRARAGDRPRRRGGDEIHDDPGRRRTRCRRMPPHRVRHRAFAAGQDRVLRVRSEPRPHRLRDRQRGRTGPRWVARVVLARRRAGRRSGARAASYREEDGQRVMKHDEITVRVALGRGEATATVWTCDFSHDYVSINADYRS